MASRVSQDLPRSFASRTGRDTTIGFLSVFLPESNEPFAQSVREGPANPGGPTWIRTRDQPVMHPTTAFAAPNRVCGLDYPFTPKGARRLVSTPSSVSEARLGITMPIGLGFPEFGGSRLGIAPQVALVHSAWMRLQWDYDPYNVHRLWRPSTG